MIVSAFRLTLFGLSFALSVMPAVADGPPILNIGPSCSAAAEGAAGLGRNRQMCLDSERTALALLQKNWSQFSAAHKTQCVGLSARSGPQSYVELISCLETMTAADALHKTEPTDRAVAEIKPARTFVSGYSDSYSESPTITKPKPKTSSSAPIAADSGAMSNSSSSNQNNDNPLQAVVRWLSGVLTKK